MSALLEVRGLAFVSPWARELDEISFRLERGYNFVAAARASFTACS